ncbi:MAG: hypothetical protein ABEK02_01440 [Haloquadratum sp.]
MWSSRNSREGTTVVCIACGSSIPRSEAREYDKQGDRWERRGKSFEHLCKECYRDLCHQPREGLEALLVELEESDRPTATDADRDAVDRDTDAERDQSQAAFLARYFRAVAERSDSTEETERGS